MKFNNEFIIIIIVVVVVVVQLVEAKSDFFSPSLFLSFKLAYNIDIK
jgi:hypothetical protein